MKTKIKKFYFRELKKESYKFDEQKLLGVFSTKKIFDVLLLKEESVFINGFHVRTNSLRIKTFLKNKFCVSCEAKGLFFRLEKNIENKNFDGYLNLYCEKNGKYEIMTKDHIIPLSKKGKNNLENLQTMCYTCNQLKGNK